MISPVSAPTLDSHVDSSPRNRPARVFFIDNLRWTIIVLVLSMHAADTYSPFGSWYFVDRRPIELPSLVFFAAWQMVLQAFFMGLLYFLAGYFVPYSFDRKGPRRFVRDRLYRLGLPVLLYMFVIGPFTEYYAAHSWNSTLPTSFLHEWIKHIFNGEVWQENGPLWFCVVLLVFSLLYCLYKVACPRRLNDSLFRRAFPGLGLIAGFGLLMSAATFAVRIGMPQSVLNLPIRDCAQYVFLFAAGIVAARAGWLSGLRVPTGWTSLIVTISASVAVLLALLKYGGFQYNQSAFFGGFHWQSAAFAVWESTVCLAIGGNLLSLFATKYNGGGGLSRFMSDNAFSVYVFHPPILIYAATALRSLRWPSVAMFLMLWFIAVIASFTLSATVFRRIPILKRIL